MNKDQFYNIYQDKSSCWSRSENYLPLLSRARACIAQLTSKVSVPPFANLLCQSLTYLLLEAFIKVTNDLVTFHREANVLLRVFQHWYIPEFED